MNSSSTLFVSNLDVPRVSRADLVALLYERFSAFGQVVGVNKGRNRGEVFVALATPQQAASAAKRCQGESFLGKILRVEIARKNSDCIAKINGTYKPKLPR